MPRCVMRIRHEMEEVMREDLVKLVGTRSQVYYTRRWGSGFAHGPYTVTEVGFDLVLENKQAGVSLTVTKLEARFWRKV